MDDDVGDEQKRQRQGDHQIAPAAGLDDFSGDHGA